MRSSKLPAKLQDSVITAETIGKRVNTLNQGFSTSGSWNVGLFTEFQ